MPTKPALCVPDSWSVMAFLEGEPASEQVTELVVEAHEHSIPMNRDSTGVILQAD